MAGGEGGDSQAITASYVPCARGGCSRVELEGDVILVDEASRAVHLLNPTAQIVWSCLDGSATIADIAADLDAVFAADRATITEAVTGLVRRLGDSGLLEGVRPEGASPLDGQQDRQQDPRFAERAPNT
ncbi:MAG TPA: PqqD family protein [Acidimicrobiales bacterium]|nr:PqqD family protein [Acidimicrobiales bacterium]